ncbi:uncharacterized protein MONBRDRAFT_11120 [Monosiga brevicollis MX1]|uniref:Uncharacterized protein n=1 Tax=Monosiga brevicollis TaxID=81824 RepID=A9V896_MONBE|nr:uncharacterized protein MONBRDRAFT_11120 [Monosiga brevicollis MX1]EDQ86232.1 predicted protein [Monosiga brevicollis MX1]|eukprot:XP_001748902.1 hypothetical protein [Monosiga brevicollis MX1]
MLLRTVLVLGFLATLATARDSCSSESCTGNELLGKPYSRRRACVEEQLEDFVMDAIPVTETFDDYGMSKTCDIAQIPMRNKPLIMESNDKIIVAGADATLILDANEPGYYSFRRDGSAGMSSDSLVSILPYMVLDDSCCSEWKFVPDTNNTDFITLVWARMCDYQDVDVPILTQVSIHFLGQLFVVEVSAPFMSTYATLFHPEEPEAATYSPVPRAYEYTPPNISATFYSANDTDSYAPVPPHSFVVGWEHGYGTNAHVAIIGSPYQANMDSVVTYVQPQDERRGFAGPPPGSIVAFTGGAKELSYIVWPFHGPAAAFQRTLDFADKSYFDSLKDSCPILYNLLKDNWIVEHEQCNLA